MDLSTEAVSGRGRQPTYEELWGSTWRQPHHEPFRASGRSGVCLFPILATLLAVIVGSMSLAGIRKQIVRAVPATSALYAAAGLQQALRALPAHLEVTPRNSSPRRFSAGRNRQSPPRPQSRHADRTGSSGEDGRTLYRWTASASKPKLGPNESIAFETRLVAPPEAGRNIKVRFAQMN
jgi:hypothetical protein